MRTTTKACAMAAALILGAGTIAYGYPSHSTTAGATAARPSVAAKASAASETITFRVGQRGDSFETAGLWRLRLKPGLYHADLRATLLLQPADPDATQVAAICGIINLENFGTENTRIFMADSTVELADGVPAAMSGASTFRVGPDVRLGLVCFSQGSTIQLFQPIMASFTPAESRRFGVSKPVEIPMGKLARILHGS